jgi:signal transduction histidine kinase
MVMGDITAFKQMEEVRMLLELKAHKMESIGTLASGIAHDFNNILTTIVGYTKMSMKDIGLLSRGEQDIDVVLGELEEIRGAANRARDLVNHILAFSRYPEKEHAPIDVTDAVRDALKVLRPTLPSNVVISEDLPEPYTIMGDPTGIYQVLTNLCNNAAHAMGRAGGRIEVGLQRVVVDEAMGLDMPQGPCVRLRVRDNGPGMTERVAARIFDPYFTTKWKSQGTGLGLSIVHGIIKGHGGAIACSTTTGEGTTFDIYLPEHQAGAEHREASARTVQDRKDAVILDLDDASPGEQAQGMKQTPAGTKGRNKTR